MAVVAMLLGGVLDAPAKAGTVQAGQDQVLRIDGRAVFPITLTKPPPPDMLAPSGRPAYVEFHDAGVTFIRTGPSDPQTWTDAYLETELRYQAAAASAGIRCAPYLRELASFTPEQTDRRDRLVEIVNRLKGLPGMGVWKGADEPQWGKIPVEQCERAYTLIRQLDPNHPVWIVQAPRGTVEQLKPYTPGYDIGGTDIYPISYPPGVHSLLPNKEISMVGDYANAMRDVNGPKPFWMTLQIAWSGVAKADKTLRMPTFAQQRYMTYQAIIDGARGLVYFGGHVPQAWNERDAKLQWNWTFWERVLKPVLDEVGEKGPLVEALTAADSAAGVKVNANGIEFTVRSTPAAIYVIAAKREGETVRPTFTGLPVGDQAVGQVLFESPRTVTAAHGEFTDWFAPFDVHVYRFAR